MNRLIAGVLCVCASAAGASAQCNLYRHGIPDFDQVRTTLPNSGNMYCVPTSATNLLGYIANRGVPSVMGGSRDWQNNNNYAYVTQRLQLMGTLMGTSPTGGTSGSSSALGLRSYLSATAPGFFTVSSYYGDYNVSHLASHFVLGRLVNVCYGFYNAVPGGRYSRNGGHCVTLSGLIDFCEPSYRIRWRDPATGGVSPSTQSIFASSNCNASSEIFTDGGHVLRNRIRLWDLGVGTNSRRYLDGMLTINPMVTIGGSVTTTDSLNVMFPGSMLGFTPPNTEATIPGDDPVTQIALDPQQIEAFVVTYDDPAHLYRLWRRNLATGATTELLSAEVPVRVATSRHGDIFVALGNVLRRYTFNGDTLDLVQQTSAAQAFKVITYDDTRDEIVGISTDNRLLRFRQQLSIPPFNRPLPAAVVADGDVSLAIDESTQRYYIAGTTANEIYVVGLAPGADILLLEGEIGLPAVQIPGALQFTDEGTLVIISEGVVGEFQNGPAGWQPRKDSILTGLQAARTLVIGRSRSNFTPGVHDTPEWDNVLVDEGTIETPDCAPDFNLDGVLNSQDLFDFLSAFFNGDASADFNFDSAIASQDFFDYLTAFFNGCV